MPQKTVHRRGGSNFHLYERDLVSDLVAHLPAYLKRSNRTCVVHREVGVGRSIADVVATLFPARTARIPPALSVRDSVLVNLLRQNGPTRIDVLERLCSMPAKSLRGEPIHRLQTSGIVTVGDGGRVALTRWCRTGALVAIEAKLTRWLDALEQAYEYRRFADRVYVALPADCLAPAIRAHAMFESAGIGLLAVNSHVRQEIRAAAVTTHDWRREYVYGRLLADGDGGDPTA